MSTVMINDLPMNKELDREAMAELSGRGKWHLISSSIVTGNWGSYSKRFSQYQGTTFHDGYLQRKYYEGWKRERTQTEYSYWNKYVKV